jgi:hypothetical protein
MTPATELLDDRREGSSTSLLRRFLPTRSRCLGGGCAFLTEAEWPASCKTTRRNQI